MWDPKTHRFLLSSQELEELQVNPITKEEMYRRMKCIRWNGLEWYPSDFYPVDGEIGHDEEARYILLETPKA